MKPLEISESKMTFIGRGIQKEKTYWSGLSGTGIGFLYRGRTLQIRILGDDSTSGNETEGKARISIYLNKKRIWDKMITEKEENFEAVMDSETDLNEVKILKLSESAMSTMIIGEILIEEDAEVFPLPEPDFKIEFVGDSITCGYGVDSSDPESGFLTETEDVTKGYAFLTAESLKCAYSMVSYSGYGVLSGYTEENIPATSQLVPTYYEKMGFSYANHPDGTSLQDLTWDFAHYQPDLIVVNLGTNDDSYCQDVPERHHAFILKYIEFLKLIRNKNQKSKILCGVGIMGQRIYPSIENAVQNYMEQTGDKNLALIKWNMQDIKDGYASDYHPSSKTHSKASKQLVEKIKELYPNRTF